MFQANITRKLIMTPGILSPSMARTSSIIAAMTLQSAISSFMKHPFEIESSNNTTMIPLLILKDDHFLETWKHEIIPLIPKKEKLRVRDTNSMLSILSMMRRVTTNNTFNDNSLFCDDTTYYFNGSVCLHNSDNQDSDLLRRDGRDRTGVELISWKLFGKKFFI